MYSHCWIGYWSKDLLQIKIILKKSYNRYRLPPQILKEKNDVRTTNLKKTMQKILLKKTMVQTLYIRKKSSNKNIYN